MRVAALGLGADCAGQGPAAAARLRFEIAERVEPYEHAALRRLIIPGIIVFEGRLHRLELGEPIAWPHRPAERAIMLGREMARMNLLGDVEVKRPLVVSGSVGADHEPVEDLVGEVLIDDLRHVAGIDRKSTRLNSSHQIISYAVFCLKKKKKTRSNCSRKKKKKNKKKKH